MATEHTAHAVGVGTLLWPFINLTILVSFLTYKLKAPLGEFIKNRHTFVRDEVIRVGALLEDAKRKHGEFSAKLGSMNTEADAMKVQMRQDAESLKIRINAEAKRMAAGIVADAQTSANGMVLDLRRKLTMEMGMRIIDRAEVLIRSRLTGDDRVRIRKDFSQQVESGKGGAR